MTSGDVQDGKFPKLIQAAIDALQPFPTCAPRFSLRWPYWPSTGLSRTSLSPGIDQIALG